MGCGGRDASSVSVEPSEPIHHSLDGPYKASAQQQHRNIAEFVAPLGYHSKHETCTASRPWRCDKAVRDYINDKKVLAIVAKLEAARAPVNQWLRWYDTAGTEALEPGKAPGPAPRLDPAQRGELTRLIEAELQVAGYRGSDHQVSHVVDDRIDHFAQRLTAGLAPYPDRDVCRPAGKGPRRAEAREGYAGDRHDSCNLRWLTA